MSLQLTGIHHLTAITANAPENLRFYTGTLGLRLVKKTVNQDDTTAYHLFYADGQATPRHGSDLLRLAGRTRRTRHAQHLADRASGRQRRNRAVVEEPFR